MFFIIIFVIEIRTTDMKTKLNTSEYSRVDLMTICGVTFKSIYNHNYYYNKATEDIILEESDDDQTCSYYRVIEDGHSFKKNYLGQTEDEYGFGIFDDDYEGCPSRNENGEVELDDIVK